MNKFNKIIYFGRQNCKYSNKLKKLLKKNSKTFYYVESKEKGEKINLKNLIRRKYDFIFCFRSYYILKKNLLKKAKYSINFHPSTPKYRGSGGVNFAIYNNDKFYGCTCHLINEKIDAGDILDTKIFKLNKNDSVENILNKTYKLMFKQATMIVDLLLRKSENVMILKNKNKKKWSKKLTLSKDLLKFYEIKKNISKKKFDKKLQATIFKNFKPYIKLHGKVFYLK